MVTGSRYRRYVTLSLDSRRGKRRVKSGTGGPTGRTSGSITPVP